MPGSLDKIGGRRFNLLLSKRLHLLPPFFQTNPARGILSALAQNQRVKNSENFNRLGLKFKFENVFP
jgi:hypothetical protein